MVAVNKKLQITNYKLQNRGFTLVELLVAVTVFVLVVVSASEIFVFTIRNQRKFLASQRYYSKLFLPLIW